MRTVVLLALAAIAITAPATAQETARRYTIDFSVMKDGAPVASARALIAEGGQAEINLVAADGAYTFTADLQPEQGDGGEDRLMLEAYVNRDGEDLAQPRLLVERGGRALMQIGSSNANSNGLQEGVQISLAPVAE